MALLVPHADLVSLVVSSSLPDLTGLIGLTGFRSTDDGQIVELQIVEVDGDQVTVANVDTGTRIAHDFRRAKVLRETEWDCPEALHDKLSKAAAERLSPSPEVLERRAIQRLAAEMRTPGATDWVIVANCLRKASLYMEKETKHSRRFVAEVSYRYKTSADFSGPQRKYLFDLAERALGHPQRNSASRKIATVKLRPEAPETGVIRNLRRGQPPSVDGHAAPHPAYG